MHQIDHDAPHPPDDDAYEREERRREEIADYYGDAIKNMEDDEIQPEGET